MKSSDPRDSFLMTKVYFAPALAMLDLSKVAIQSNVKRTVKIYRNKNYCNKKQDMIS